MRQSDQILENLINAYIWCFVGAAIGFLAGKLMAGEGRIVVIENVAVGIFGAVIGGDALAPRFNASAAAGEFHIASLAIAAACAVAGILLLGLMRRRVGPLRRHKAPPRR